MGSAGIVQVRKPVAESRPKMQQGTGRFLRHSSIPIGGAGHNSFEKSQDTPHFRYAIQRGDDVNFRCARVSEAAVNSTGQQCSYQALSPGHY
jgi:hypothetical protein